MNDFVINFKKTLKKNLPDCLYTFRQFVLGGFIGNMASGVRGLSWLNYGQSFGLMDPVVLDLGILVITFGLSIRVTMASIIGVVIALIAYRLI